MAYKFSHWKKNKVLINRIQIECVLPKAMDFSILINLFLLSLKGFSSIFSNSIGKVLITLDEHRMKNGFYFHCFFSPLILVFFLHFFTTIHFSNVCNSFVVPYSVFLLLSLFILLKWFSQSDRLFNSSRFATKTYFKHL